jgi:hypothetical protein
MEFIFHLTGRLSKLQNKCQNHSVDRALLRFYKRSNSCPIRRFNNINFFERYKLLIIFSIFPRKIPRQPLILHCVFAEYKYLVIKKCYPQFVRKPIPELGSLLPRVLGQILIKFNTARNTCFDVDILESEVLFSYLT